MRSMQLPRQWQAQAPLSSLNQPHPQQPREAEPTVSLPGIRLHVGIGRDIGLVDLFLFMVMV